ncbi:MAG: hypothetical protein ACK55I_06365, partial [bacterium]
PCLTPFLMLMDELGAMLGETQTSVRRFCTARMSQGGKPCLVSVARIKLWRMESKALRLSVKRVKNSSPDRHLV